MVALLIFIRVKVRAMFYTHNVQLQANERPQRESPTTTCMYGHIAYERLQRVCCSVMATANNRFLHYRSLTDTFTVIR